MKRMLGAALLVVVALAAYLLLWPVPIEPASWSAPKTPGYAGPHAANKRLATLRHLPLGGDVGPEHVVVREQGGQTWIWMAVVRGDHAGGRIIRMKPDGSGREVIVDTGGRPLGFDFDAQGALIVADPMFGKHGGLLRVTGRGGAAKIEVLTDSVDGDALRYVDAVVIAKNGRVYFSDASRRFGSKAWGGSFEASVLDIIEHQSTGRILEYDPATQKTRILMLADLQDPSGAYPETSGATEAGELLYVHSLHATTLGVLERRVAGF